MTDKEYKQALRIRRLAGGLAACNRKLARVHDELDKTKKALAIAQDEKVKAQALAYEANQRTAEMAEEVEAANKRAAKIYLELDELHELILGKGPMCRDCADCNGRCQNVGRPCDPKEAIVEQLAKWKAMSGNLSNIAISGAREVGWRH